MFWHIFHKKRNHNKELFILVCIILFLLLVILTINIFPNKKTKITYEFVSNEIKEDSGIKLGHLVSINEKELKIDLITSMRIPTYGEDKNYLGNNKKEINIDPSVLTFKIEKNLDKRLIEKLNKCCSNLSFLLDEKKEKLIFTKTQNNGLNSYKLSEPQTFYPFYIFIKDGIVFDIDLAYRE